MSFFKDVFGRTDGLQRELTQQNAELKCLKEENTRLKNNLESVWKLNFHLRERIAQGVERSQNILFSMLKKQEQIQNTISSSTTPTLSSDRTLTPHTAEVLDSQTPFISGFQCVQENLPLHALPDGRLSFAPHQGTSQEKVAVISIPKAGTYLLAKYLETLGFVDSGVHVDGRCIIDLRGKTKQQMAEEYFKFQPELPIIISSKLVAPGQFFVGHLQYEWCHEYLEGFRRILAVREMRHAVVSYMRWLKGHASAGPAAQEWIQMKEGPEKLLRFMDSHCDQYFESCRKMRGWVNDPNIHLVRFEEFAGQKGEKLQKRRFAELARFLNCDSTNTDQLITQVIGAETKTFSGKHSEIDTYWNEEVERRFLELGGKSLNDNFGYEL